MDNISNYCVCDGEKPIGIIGAPASGLTNNVFVYVSDNYLHIFDEKFPGFSGTIEINYCPLCGRRLKRAAKVDTA